MAGYFWRRIPEVLVVLLGVSFISFFLMHLSGDPALMMLPRDATHEQIEAFRRQMGFDQPILVQYWRFLSGAVRGDFGMSLAQRLPAAHLAMQRLPATLELAFWAMLWAVVLAVPVGILSAAKRRSIWDHLTMVFTLAGQSMPTFWLGILLVLIFSVRLGWLPTSGRGTWAQLILPAVTLGTYYLAMIARLTRSGLLEVLGLDYIRTARAKGLSETKVVLKHALKNSVIPLVTVLGLQFGRLLGGAVITESVFEWPGLGRLVVTAINQRDYPVVQVAVLIFAVAFVLINFITDMLYAFLDPRIRYR